MARALDKNYFKNSKNFGIWCKKLNYASIEEQAQRYSALTEGLFGKISFFSSSGRVELVGNHTDHNHGLVLAATVNLDTAAAVTAREDGVIVIKSAGYPDVRVSVDDIAVNPKEYGDSHALVRGVVKGFIDRGFKVGGFNANTHSNIFKGAGVSSSAAFELLICEILNVLYNDGKIDFVTKALIAQFAENKYFGKPSGLMDQLTISRGGVSYMDFEDAVHPSSFSVEWKFENITPIIINCGGDHCNLTDEYAAIREDMKKVSAALGKECLREVDEKIFYDNIALLHKRCGGRAVLRAKHFFEENIRVKKALAAINNNDEKLFIDCINASGVSSYEQLQNCYPAFDREQNIPLALQLANTRDCVKAARVHGGGFAGTILVFADKEKADGFIDYMAGIFGRENIFSLSMRGLGATMLEV